MFSVRTARGRAIFGSAVLVVLFAGIAAGALWRVQDNQERDERLEHASAAAVALEHARAQFYLEAAAASALMFVRDPALAERSRLAAAELGQDLSQARAGMIASGKADDLAALDALIEEIDAVEAEIDAAMPFLLTADREAIATLASTRWPVIWPTIETTMDGLEDLAAAQEADLSANIEVQQRGTGIVRWIVVGLSGFAFLIVAGVVALVVSVVRPLAALRASAKAITVGDLEARASVSGPEEVASLARDFNEMTDSLAAMTKEYIDTTNLTGVVLLRTDKDNRVIFLNDAMCQFLGRPREEVLGTDIVGYLHPDDATSTAKAVQRMVRSKGLVTGVVTRYVTPMGIRVTEWSGYPIFDEEGRYAGLHGTGRDITERKRAEESVRRAEERYRRLFEEAPVMYVITCNQAGVPIITDCNELFTSTLGYTRAEVLGRPLDDLYTPESRAELLEGGGYQRALDGRFIGEERHLVACDGRIIQTLLRALPETDPDGQVFGTRAMYIDITERKRAEEALRESEERLRILFEFAPDAYYLHDLEGNFIDGNRVAVELSGYEREELIGKSLFESNLFPPEQLPRAAATVAKLVQGLPTGPDEFTLIRKDGKHVAVETRGFLVKIGDQTLVLGIGRDISERKRAEEALRKSEERYRRLADSITDVFFAMDRDLRYTYWNKASEKLTGISAADAIGRSLYDIFPEVKGTMIDQLYQEVLRTQQPRSFVNEYRVGGKDFVFEISAYPSGTGLSVFVRDVSERRRAEEALRESEERYRLLAENASDVIWTMDTNLRFTYISPSITQLRGYTVEEAMAQTLEECLTPASLKVAKKVIAAEQAIEGSEWKELRRSPTVELEGLCKDGSTVWTEVKFVILRDSDGQPIGTLGVTRDITQRKRAEETLRESEEKYRKLIHDSIDGIVIAEGLEITLVNRALAKMLGYDNEQEIVGRPFTDLVSPEYRELMAERGHARDRGEDVSARYDFKALRKDGSEFDAEVSVSRIDYRGRIARQAVIKDVSERKRAEEALRESEEQYRAIFEQAADSVLLIDPETGGLVEFNDRAHQALGYSRQEFEKLRIPDFEAVESPEEVAKHMEKIIEEGADIFETKHRTRSGEIRDVEIRTTAISIRGRDFIQTIFHDVSERKRAEEALRESEERFRGLAEATFEGLAIHDKGRIIDANQTYASMFGYELSEVIGMHALDFAAPESRDLVQQRILSGSGEPFEAVGLRKDGSTFPGEIWGRVLPYRGRKVTVTAIRDISERKQAEEALRRAREEVESRVERRVQEVNGYGLTFRELTVLHLVAAGESDKEIAAVLGISPLTAHKHLANILEKMGASCRTEAGVRALREGLLG